MPRLNTAKRSKFQRVFDVLKKQDPCKVPPVGYPNGKTEHFTFSYLHPHHWLNSKIIQGANTQKSKNWLEKYTKIAAVTILQCNSCSCFRAAASRGVCHAEHRMETQEMGITNPSLPSFLQASPAVRCASVLLQHPRCCRATCG